MQFTYTFLLEDIFNSYIKRLMSNRVARSIKCKGIYLSLTDAAIYRCTVKVVKLLKSMKCHTQIFDLSIVNYTVNLSSTWSWWVNHVENMQIAHRPQNDLAARKYIALENKYWRQKFVCQVESNKPMVCICWQHLLMFACFFQQTTNIQPGELLSLTWSLSLSDFVLLPLITCSIVGILWSCIQSTFTHLFCCIFFSAGIQVPFPAKCPAAGFHQYCADMLVQCLGLIPVLNPETHQTLYVAAAVHILQVLIDVWARFVHMGQ